MKVIRLSILFFVSAAIWAGAALGMPAPNPDILVTKSRKAVPAPASGFDWTYVAVAVGVAAVVLLVVGTLVNTRRRHTGAPVQA